MAAAMARTLGAPQTIWHRRYRQMLPMDRKRKGLPVVWALCRKTSSKATGQPVGDHDHGHRPKEIAVTVQADGVEFVIAGMTKA